MVQSHTALRGIRRLREKSRRASNSQPLTPALSLRERENPPLTFIRTQRGVWPTPFRTTEPAAVCSLSPWERVRVRGIGLPFQHSDSDPSRNVELRESSGARAFS